MKIRVCTYALAMAGVFILLTNSCQKSSDNNSNNNNSGNDIAPIVFNYSLTYGTMTDQSGNTYKTITIGTQTWMAENLRTTKYRNGDPIPNVTDETAWARLSTGAYCYDNNNSNSSTIYGRLYNYYAILDSRNIAPTGWHVATVNDWNTLVNRCGGTMVAGNKLKEKGWKHWLLNMDATNESGFTALPNCTRFDNGFWDSVSLPGASGTWWCNSGNTDNLVCWNLNGNNGDVTSNAYGNDAQDGNPVRCVKD